jgi:hypothetical protein
MGMLELIQQKSFLGKEFLTWLWFRGERDNEAPAGKGQAPVTVEMLGPITLDAQFGDARASALKGESPATSPEAQTALMQGKKLKKAKLKLTREDGEWTATLDGDTFAISGLAIPNQGKLPFEELVSLRTSMVLEFESILGLLFEQFMELRLDEKLWARELKEIQSWVENK